MENILGIIGIVIWGIVICFIGFMVFYSIWVTIKDIVEDYKEDKLTNHRQTNIRW